MFATARHAVLPPKIVSVRLTCGLAAEAVLAVRGLRDRRVRGAPASPEGQVVAGAAPHAQPQVQTAALLIPQDHEVAGLAVVPRVAVRDQLRLGSRARRRTQAGTGSCMNSKAMNPLPVLLSRSQAKYSQSLPAVALGVEPCPAQVDLRRLGFTRGLDVQLWSQRRGSGSQSSAGRLRHLMPAAMKPSRSPSNTAEGLLTS